MKFTANRERLVYLSTWAEMELVYHATWAKMAKDARDRGIMGCARDNARFARELLARYLKLTEAPRHG